MKIFTHDARVREMRSPVKLSDWDTADNFYSHYHKSLEHPDLRDIYMKFFNAVMTDKQTPFHDFVNPETLAWEKLGAKMIFDMNLFPENLYQREFLNEIDNDRIFRYFPFLENGEWDPLNKLNGNYIGAPYVLLHSLFEHGKTDADDAEHLETALNSIIQRNDNSDLIGFLQYLMTGDTETMDYMYNNYINAEPHKNRIRELIQSKSDSGDKNEKIVIDFLKSKNWTIDWSGGCGSVVDQIFHCDVIATSPTGVRKSIQIKTVNAIIPLRLTKYEGISQNGLVYEVESHGTLKPSRIRGYNLMIFVTNDGKIISMKPQYNIMRLSNGEMVFDETSKRMFPYRQSNFKVISVYDDVISDDLLPD